MCSNAEYANASSRKLWNTRSGPNDPIRHGRHPFTSSGLAPGPARQAGLTFVSCCLASLTHVHQVGAFKKKRSMSSLVVFIKTKPMGRVTLVSPRTNQHLRCCVPPEIENLKISRFEGFSEWFVLLRGPRVIFILYTKLPVVINTTLRLSFPPEDQLPLLKLTFLPYLRYEWPVRAISLPRPF
jgi:hypothetical protein